MNSLPAGYVSRGDGTYAKTVQFVDGRKVGSPGRGRETLVRSARGKLLRVERRRKP